VIEFRLWDILSGQQLKGLRYTAPEQSWRRIAHKIADQVYERLTGEPGYFDSWIAYTAETGSGTGAIKRIALMDQDGANARYLTDGRFLALNPRIAPDTRQLAFTAFRSGPARIYMQQLATGRDALLGNFPGMSFAPRFSPDGSSMLVTIAKDGNSDIFRYGIGSRQLTRLTDSAAIDTSPSYSPDGSRICFTSDRGGTQQLYIMGSDGGGAKRVSYGSGRYGDPAWSPKGDMIAFTNIKGGAFHIGVMRPDGSGERLITQSVLDEAPSWAPNGRRLVFARGKSGSRLYTIDVSGYGERPLSTSTAAGSPDWSRLLP
jgi:TolB protein